METARYESGRYEGTAAPFGEIGGASSPRARAASNQYQDAAQFGSGSNSAAASNISFNTFNGDTTMLARNPGNNNNENKKVHKIQILIVRHDTMSSSITMTAELRPLPSGFFYFNFYSVFKVQ